MTIPIALVASGSAVLFPAGGQDDLLERVRAAISSEAPFAALIGVFTAMGVLDLPPFACVVTDGHDVRVLVRGAGSARVCFVDGRTTVVAARDGVTTWREEAFGGVIVVELTTHDGPPVSRLELVVAPTDSAPLLPESLEHDGLSIREQGPAAEPSADAELVGDHAPASSPSATDATLVLPSDLHETRAVEEPRVDPPVLSSPSHADEFDFAHLLEETHYRGVEAAAVREAAAEATDTPVASPESRENAGDPTRTGLTMNTAVPSLEPASASQDGLIASVPIAVVPDTPGRQLESVLGDHDGHTISVAALREIQGDLVQVPSIGPQVQAVFCVNGHPNPPIAPACRRCRGAISDRTVREVDRPAIGILRMSTGASVELDRSLLVGRRPTVGGIEPSDLVGLVVVPDPDHSLSRLHAEIRLEGWEVYVVDLDSKNGTYVQIPGQTPMKLRAGEPCMVVPGTRMRLGDVVEMHYEVPES